MKNTVITCKALLLLVQLHDVVDRSVCPLPEKTNCGLLDPSVVVGEMLVKKSTGNIFDVSIIDKSEVLFVCTKGLA